MPNLIGTAPDQVPVNGFLGNMAFQNKEGVVTDLLSTTALTVTGAASFAGTIATGLGSAAAPSYTFIGDTNTGIFSPAADTIAFSEGGVEAMRITSAGNVGIGTSAPAAKLEVAGQVRSTTGTGFKIVADYSDYRMTTVNGRGWRMGTTSNGTNLGDFYIQGSTDDFVTSFISPFYINSSGNVGIGTSSPAARLDVQVTGGRLQVQSAVSTTGIRLLPVNAANSATVPIEISGTDIRFTNPLNAVVGIFDANGNLGVGTSSPTSKLNVSAGLANVGLTWGAASTSSGLLTVGTNGYLGSAWFNTPSGNPTYACGLGIDGSFSEPIATVNIKAFGPKATGGYGSDLCLYTSNETSSLERMRIDRLGNVGIGTASPSSLGLNITTLDISGAAGGAVRFQRTATTATSGYISALSGEFRVSVVDALPLTFFTTNAERMRIDSSGRVMVGSTANAFGSKMEIVTSGSNNLLSLVNTTADGGAKILFVDGTNNAAVGNLGGNLLFYANGASSERMRLTSAGNFGINTTTPGVRLDVVGSIRASQSVSIGSDGTYEGGSIYSDANWGMLFRAKQPSPTQAQYRWATSADVELMRIDPSGRMMVGRTSALNNGTIEALGTSRQAFVAQVTNNANSLFQGFNAAGTATFYATGSGDVFLNSITALGTGPLTIGVNSAERMRIASNGDVSIGTSSALGGKLNVFGGYILVQNGAGTAQGVFGSTSTTVDLEAVGANAVRINTNGAERMRIASDGNVTLTNKIIPNVQSVASAATITPNANTDTQVSVTALAVAATIAAPSGTPSDGQSLVIRIEDNGTARALTWTTGSSGAYRPVGITLPTTTVATKTMYVGFKYNSTDLRWDAIALSQEA